MGGGVKLNSRGLDRQGLRRWLAHFCFLHLRNIAKKQTFSVIQSSGTYTYSCIPSLTSSEIQNPL